MSDAADILGRLQILQQQDWVLLTIELLQYAAARCQGHALTVSGGAVRGVSLADLVHDVIESVWSGRRHWDHDKVHLLVFLRNVIRSEISNLFDLAEVKLVDDWPEGGDEETSSEDKLLNQYADPSHDHAHHLPRLPKSPEEIVLVSEELEWRHDLFLEAAGDDDGFIRYLDALDRGIEKPALIAQEWKVGVKEIYALEGRFRRQLRKVWQSRNNRPTKQ